MPDLTDLFTPPPPGPAQAVSYRQGTVIAFDKFTLANTIRVGGTDLTDLPILGVGETTMLGPGDVVGILVVGSTLAILGQLVIPNTTAAFDAISLPSSNTYTANVNTAQSTTSTTWTDLATVGPTISNVRIGPSGRCLVFISATMNILSAPEGGSMGYDITGATTLGPSDQGRDLAHYGSTGASLSATRLVLQEGLNTGLHTFTAKYFYGGGAGSISFSFRNLTVMAL